MQTRGVIVRLLSPNFGGFDAEGNIFLQKLGHHGIILCLRKSAGCIKNQAARPHETSGTAEELQLPFRVGFDGARRPLCQRCRALLCKMSVRTAWSVNEHLVKRPQALHGHRDVSRATAATQYVTVRHVYASSNGCELRRQECLEHTSEALASWPRRFVAHKHATLRSHEQLRRNHEGFSSWSGAQVEHLLTRSNFQSQGGHHRRSVKMIARKEVLLDINPVELVLVTDTFRLAHLENKRDTLVAFELVFLLVLSLRSHRQEWIHKGDVVHWSKQRAM
mmetsp:Transcript_47882/g.126758  ORF Transcript_47882/g.126758 Transcript_47882/m.126758 type:complete len:278 (-) Transcript_47882:95-928(-)